MLCDAGGVGASLAEVLREAGNSDHRHASVEFGTTAAAFRIDPDNPEHYGRVLAAVGPASGLNVVHLWNLDAPGNDALRSRHSGRSLGRGTATLGYVLGAKSSGGAQAYARRRHPVCHRCAGRLRPDLRRAGARVGPRTNRGTRAPRRLEGCHRPRAGRTGLIWPGCSPENCWPACDDDQVALRRRGRFVARLVRKPRAAGVPRTLGRWHLSRDRRAGSAGTAFGRVAHRAGRSPSGPRRAALAPRRPPPSTIERLRALGAGIEVVALDVSQPDAVESLVLTLAAAGRPLRGVVHAAGIDATVPLAIPMTSCRPPRRPRRGAWLLHDRTRGLELDLFVCFSSIASILGAFGRAHYGAANAFLDALAAERRRLGLAVTA